MLMCNGTSDIADGNSKSIKYLNMARAIPVSLEVLEIYMDVPDFV